MIAGTPKKALIKKNSGQEVSSKTLPEVAPNTSLAKPDIEDNNAYCVAVYPCLHKTDINAIIAVVAIPDVKFSKEITAIKEATS